MVDKLLLRIKTAELTGQNESFDSDDYRLGLSQHHLTQSHQQQSDILCHSS
jgi:hypothetical protein